MVIRDLGNSIRRGNIGIHTYSYRHMTFYILDIHIMPHSTLTFTNVRSMTPALQQVCHTRSTSMSPVSYFYNIYNSFTFISVSIMLYMVAAVTTRVLVHALSKLLKVPQGERGLGSDEQRTWHSRGHEGCHDVQLSFDPIWLVFSLGQHAQDLEWLLSCCADSRYSNKLCWMKWKNM